MVVREGEESRRRLGFRAAEMESLVRQRGGEGWTDFRDVPEWQKQPLSRLFLQLFLSFPAGKAGIPIWIQVNLIILYIRTEQREVHMNIPKSFVGSVSIEWEIN